jgi:glutathione S-transferase
MKLVFTPNPEYIHKVLVTAYEAGVLDRLHMERQVPFDEDTNIWKYNPLGKVPAFIMDNGKPLYGGLVICEYLDSFNKKAPLFPKDETRWQALRQMVTGDGVFDATTLVRVESWRDKSVWNVKYMLRERRKIMGALRLLEEDAKDWVKQPNVLHIGHVCTAGALSYLSLRNPIIDCKLEPGDESFDWRKSSPTLARWYEQVIQRPSMQFRLSKEEIGKYPKR